VWQTGTIFASVAIVNGPPPARDPVGDTLLGRKTKGIEFPGRISAMKPRLRSLLPLLVVVWLAAGAAGCNTMQGIGADISAAGDALEGSAKKNKSY